MEIEDRDELSMIENNSYLFVTLGKILFNFIIKGEPYDGRACLGAFHKIRMLGEVRLWFSNIFKGWIWKSVSGI